MYPTDLFQLLEPLINFGDSSDFLFGICAGDASKQYIWNLTCHVCRHKGPPATTAEAYVCEGCGVFFGSLDPDPVPKPWPAPRRTSALTLKQASSAQAFDAMLDEVAKARQEVERRIEKLRDNQSPRRWGVDR